jgi:hypothetical protein
VNAAQMQERFEGLRIEHSEPRHQRRDPGCDTCFAISVVRTAVYRDWDPFLGVPYQGMQVGGQNAATVMGPDEVPRPGDMVVAVRMAREVPVAIPDGWRTLAVVHPVEASDA